jgi:hypothetical protein
MQLSRQQLGALNAAAANRAYMARTGLTYSGQRLWTPKEITALQLYPDYQALVRTLPRRTRKAIESKVWRCALAKPLRVWSEAESSIMKRLYVQGAPMAVILSRLPGKTARQVWSKASSRNIRRPRRPPRLTGLVPVDAVLLRAFDLNISVPDLNVIAGQRSYFRSPRRTNWSVVQRVLPHLGGQAAVHWHED